MTSAETKYLTLDGSLPLENGGSLQDVVVAYRTWGEPADSAALVCHALTGNADADDWWSGLYKPGAILDPERNYVVASNVLGGCYGSTGPTSINLRTGHPYGRDFPDVTIRDMVEVQRRLLDHLGVSRVSFAIGGSMGGMQAQEWAALHPDRIDAAVSIGVGITQSAWNIALSDAQRAAITSAAGTEKGLAIARMIAMISYRSPENFDTRFGRELSDSGFTVQDYLRYQGEKLVDRFDADTYVTLINAMDSHDLARSRELASIETPILAVGISSDALYPSSDVKKLADALPNGVYRTLHASQGHDAFLIETGELNRIVAGFLNRVDSRYPAGRDGRGSAWA
ncbi:MAG: homoserine O-acetyltransferase [Actinobacteria bacterium]|nr:MAG: homoserine O-acetyltransferase [Actinomycetota bacterium]